MNPQELFIDVSSGRFLDGNSSIPTSKPSVYSDEQKKMLINVRKVRNNQVSVVTPAENARFKFRIGTPTLKLAEGIDVSTAPPVLITALANVVTAPATQATGIALLSNYTPVTATIRADVSQVTAVTAAITVGITSSTNFISLTTVGLKQKSSRGFFGSAAGASPLVLEMSATLNSPVAATITASFFGGSVTTMLVTNRGSGYPSGTFDLKFTGGGATAGTVTATGTAVASGGIITQLTLSSGGSGYASAPIVTLFTPEKSVRDISVTNKIGNFGTSRQRFYWAYATTAVSTPAVAVNFTAPDATSTTAFITTPSAVIRSVGLNIWELELISGGYGYINTPSVTHNSALVSTSKLSTVVTFDQLPNTLAYIADFSGQAYIRNGGCAVRFTGWENNNKRYLDQRFSTLNKYAQPLPNQPAVEIRDDFGGLFYLNLDQQLNSDGSVRYSAPFIGTSAESNRISNRDELRRIANLEQLFSVEVYGIYEDSFTNISIVSKPCLIKNSFGPTNLAYSIFYQKTYPIGGQLDAAGNIILKREIFNIQQGGGSFEPIFEIVDYGEGYTQAQINNGRVVPRPIASLEETTLLETVSAVSASIIPSPVDVFLSAPATISTRPGRFGTQYFISNGGFGYFGRTQAVFSTIPVATGGIVVTASLTNIPQAYDDGQYDCIVQSPSVGTAAKISFIVENGVGRSVILDGGAGYTSKPIVTAPAPNVQTGFIERAIVTNSPKGYQRGKRYLLESSFSPATGGNCSLVLVDGGSGPIVEIIERGFGYSSSPTITAPSPDLPQGVVNFVSLTNQGEGYSEGTYDCNIQQAPAGGKTPKIVFQKTAVSSGFSVIENGFGYTTAPIVSVATPAGNVVSGITITCGGSFYQTDSIIFTLNDPSGSGVLFGVPAICGGIIKSLPVANKGTGYSDSPNIVFNAPQEPAPSVISLSQVEGTLDITTASANAILTTANQRDVLLEVYETDGTNEQVVVQGTVNLAKRVLE